MVVKGWRKVYYNTINIFFIIKVYVCILLLGFSSIALSKSVGLTPLSLKRYRASVIDHQLLSFLAV